MVCGAAFFEDASSLERRRLAATRSLLPSLLSVLSTVKYLKLRSAPKKQDLFSAIDNIIEVSHRFTVDLAAIPCITNTCESQTFALN